LAGLPHVTPELVAFHAETAPNVPTAIHRIEHDWPIQTKAPQAPDGDPQRDLHDKAVRMLLKVSKLSAIPPGQLARIAQVAAMIARYGAKPTRRELVEQRESWLETEGRNGQLYSPLNFGWVDWADAELAEPDDEPPARDPLARLREYLARKDQQDATQAKEENQDTPR
jgi:hypothetical protein